MSKTNKTVVKFISDCDTLYSTAAFFAAFLTAVLTFHG